MRLPQILVIIRESKFETKKTGRTMPILHILGQIRFEHAMVKDTISVIFSVRLNGRVFKQPWFN